MDRNNQRQTKRNTTAAPSCTAEYFLSPSTLPAPRPSSHCDPVVSGPTADPFLSLTACPAPPKPPQLIPPALVIASDPTIAYCPTAAGYSLTGYSSYALSGGAQQQSVFFQTITGINNNQLNYLYEAVPSASAAIIAYSLSGNTASVQDITKLTESQTVELMGSINSTKFFINTLAVEQARNSLVCQTYNDRQYASCTSSAYFGSSAYVPASLKPYSVTAAAATGSFVVTFNLQSSTGDQAAFSLLNIPSLTAAKEQADALAASYAERQLRCVFANDFQDATCHTGAGSSINNLGYTYPVPNDTLPVLPGLDPRIGYSSVTATTVFSNISKAAANSSADTLARSQLSCYFPNEDVFAVCPTAGVASAYPLLGKYYNINWSATEDSVSILNSSLSVSDFNYNTRIVFSSTSATAPAGITYNTIYYSATATSVSGGVVIKLNSQTGSHVDYETGSTAYLVNITNSSSSVTAIETSVFADYTTGKYAYILRGRIIQNDIAASVTASTQLASSIVPSLLDCYWVNAATSATCPASSFTGVDGTGYTIPASPTTSPVYSFTIPYGNIISYISQLDADTLAGQQAEATLQCYYCNVRVDPMCTPDAPNTYPDSALPLDPAEFIPNCWSINATSGMPPNSICDIFGAGAQNTALTISSIPLRDKKIAEEVCCYESAPVSNTIFCTTGAVRGVEGLNSQDSFYLPAGTIVLCSTAGVPPRPEYRFQYDNLWVTTDLDYFCCSATTECAASGTSYYIGTLWGDATVAFETNGGYALFYPFSGSTALPYNFASTGPHGFNAQYLVQKIPAVSTVARDVVEVSGNPTPGTRYISYCPDCVTPLIPLNVITSEFSLPVTAGKITSAVESAMCSHLAGATGFNIYSSTATPFNNLFATTWYSNTCGTSIYAPASSLTGYVAAHISATGYTQYLTFSTSGSNAPSNGGTAEYPGKYGFTVGGVAYPPNSPNAFSAAQEIFCSGLSASVFTIYCSVPNPFSASYTGTKEWYSSTCGGPFTPNSGTAYVIGYTSPTGDRYYAAFSGSGINQTGVPVAYSATCHGIFPYSLVPSDAGCSAAGGATTLYSNIYGAFTTNDSATAYFYTRQYSTTAQYTPGSTLAYLNWPAPTTVVYHRSTTGPTSPFGSATSGCIGSSLYSLAVYFSNTAPSNVCNYPWSEGVSGVSGYNANVTTLYADNPAPFDNGNLTRFYSSSNPGVAYVFNNGASGSTTYIAPYNYCTNFNSVYREYQNSGVGSTAYGSSGLYSFTGFIQAPFIAASPSVGNLWETSATNPPDPSVQTDPLDYYKSMRLVNGTTATCETSTLYTDTPEMFLPVRYYSSTAYKKKVSTNLILLNDGVDVELGLATRTSSTSITLANLSRIDTVFLGAVLQTFPTTRIGPNAYVSSVDKVAGVISLTGDAVTSFTSERLKIIGFSFSVTGIGTSGTGFTTASPLISKLAPGSVIDNSGRVGYVTSSSGSEVYFNKMYGGTVTSGGSAGRLTCLGKYGTQLWTDNAKLNSVTGMYSDTGGSTGNVFKDGTEIILRSANIRGLSGSTSATGSNLFVINNALFTGTPGNQSYATYPGGTAPSEYYPVYVPDTVPNINIYCSGGSFYQAGKTRLCDNTIDSTPVSYGPLGLVPSSVYGYATGSAILQCTTGSGTAYSCVGDWQGIEKLVWNTPCDGSNTLITTPLGCWIADTRFVNAAPTTTRTVTVSLGNITSSPFDLYMYPCIYPCWDVAGFAATSSDDIQNPVAFDPSYFGDFSSFSFRDMVTAVEESGTCNAKQYEANIIAQELVNSFVRCYYLNEAVLYDTCPGTGDNPAATVKLKDGYVAPGTFVSTVSQDDATTIAESVARSLLTCVTEDQVGGGNAVYNKFDYVSSASMTLKRIVLCNGGSTSSVYVIERPFGQITPLDSIDIKVAAYKTADDPEIREFAIKPPSAP